MTGNYGKIGGRRRRSGAWQWLVIGFIPGLLCGGLVVLLLFAGDVLSSLTTTPTPVEVTRIVEVVMEVTPIPTETPQPSETPPATQTPTTDPENAGVVLVASATPTLDLTAQTTGSVAATAVNISPPGSQSALESTVNPTLPAPTVPVASSDGGQTTAQQPVTPAEPAIPEQLASIISPMVTVTGGTFQLGTTNLEILDAVDQCINRDAGNCQESYGEDAVPQVAVELPTFQLERTEVSFQQYVAFLNYLSSQGISHLTGCSGSICIQTQNENQQADITFDSANYQVNPALNAYPVYGVTWYGAQAYCQAIGRRLPTEAEWEYAAKGSAGLVYPWGNQWTAANAMTNRPPVNFPAAPVPVEDFITGQSIFSGALNMAGNVEEWVADWYDPNYYNTLNSGTTPVVDPQGPTIGTQKVIRGGSFGAVPFFARTVHRRSNAPAPPRPSDTFLRTVGFRCADDPEQTTAASSGVVDPNTLGSTIPSEADAPTAESASPGVPAPPEANNDATTSADRG